MVIILDFKYLIKNNRNARRIFGRKEIDIMLRQLDGQRLKQSERNRLSRDIKPKLRFIEEIAKFDDEFGLENNQTHKRMIKSAVDTILNSEFKDNIRAILLFGSFADNSFTNRSDIDICVIFRKDLSLKEATQFRIRISGQLPDKMDIQVFNILPQKIKKDIARNHKVLYHDPSYNNMNFSIRYLKDDDYFIRMNSIFGIEA